MVNPYGDPLARLRSKGPRKASDVARERCPPPSPLMLPKRLYVMALLFLVLVFAVPPFLRHLGAPRAPVAPPPDAGALPPKPEPAAPAPADELDTRLDEQLDKLADGHEAPSPRHPPIEALLKIVTEEMTDAQWAARLAASDATLRHMLLDPERHRGLAVRAGGRVFESYSSVQPAFLEGDLSRRVEEVYLEDQQTGHTVCFYFINENRAIQWDVESEPAGQAPVYFIKDWARIEGIFLRSYTYESKEVRGGVPTKRTAAVVLARAVRKIPAPPSAAPAPAWPGYGYVTLGAVGLLIAGLFVLARVMNRRYGGAQPLRVKLAALKRAAAQPKDPASPPAP
jgi:hypothetical protein